MRVLSKVHEIRKNLPSPLSNSSLTSWLFFFCIDQSYVNILFLEWVFLEATTRERNLSERDSVYIWSRRQGTQNLCSELVLDSEVVPGSQDTLLWCWTFPVLHPLRSWQVWSSCCWLLLKGWYLNFTRSIFILTNMIHQSGKRVPRRQQRRLHIDVTAIPAEGLRQALNSFQLWTIQTGTYCGQSRETFVWSW